MNNFKIKNISDIEEISNQIALVINQKLKEGEKVLFFATGGSSIPMQILISQKIKTDFSENLTVLLTDERYGEDNHKDSNWFKLIKGGFNINKARLIPILNNKDISETTNDFIQILEKELKEESYKIGLFGVGADSHTAGILPNSIAVNSSEFACHYDAPPFLRVTITPRTILELDEAFVYAMGESKWLVIDNLKEDLPLEENPVQFLKKIPILTIFTDKK